MARKRIDTDGIKAALRSKPAEPDKAGLSSGSTLINLLCTGDPRAAFMSGGYYFMVGDSDSGKSFLSMTCMAEATLNRAFKDYRLIRDEVEDGALMDVPRFFGKQVASRLEIKRPETVEEWYYNVDDDLKEGTPFIRVLDSMDALGTEPDQEKFEKNKRASRKGREESGSYGTSKAKANSAGIRQLLPGLHKTGSILIVISQTRDNIGFGSQFNPKVYSGGNSLKFYANLQLWTSPRGEIKKPFKGKEYQAGIISRVKLKKNRITGRHGQVDVPIYWSHGLDDLGSMIDWLVENGIWTEKKGIVNAPQLDEELKTEKLIQHIQDNDLEDLVIETVTEAWAEIEQACSVQRKRRYQ